jgi:hypothetical protein
MNKKYRFGVFVATILATIAFSSGLEFTRNLILKRRKLALMHVGLAVCGCWMLSVHAPRRKHYDQKAPQPPDSLVADNEHYFRVMGVD